LIGLEVVNVPGATGYYDTNYRGKGEYAVNCLKKKDFVFVHVEAPDEAGHNGDIREKIRAIENFDKHVVGTVWRYLQGIGDYRVAVLADHSTPIVLKTHASDPAPFVMAGAGIEHNGYDAYNETTAKASSARFRSGARLTETLMRHR
jgi:2,3-bisphosphoglycerate-independent phosphoglycerate mutase